MPAAARALEREVAARGGDEAGARLRARYKGEPREMLLGRFLAACEGEVGEAADMLVHDLRWRAKVDVDALVRRDPAEILGCEPASVLKRFLCKEFGADRGGRPVLYYRAQSIDADAVLKLTSSNAFLMYQTWLRETAIRRLGAAAAASGRVPDMQAPYYTAVMDLQGVRLAQANGRFYALIRLIAELDHRHFPGLVGQIVIVNAPIFFAVVWKVVRKFLPPQVEQRVSIIGESSRQIVAGLSALIERDQIPAELGGEAGDLDWLELPAHALDAFSFAARGVGELEQKDADAAARAIHSPGDIAVALQLPADDVSPIRGDVRATEDDAKIRQARGTDTKLGSNHDTRSFDRYEDAGDESDEEESEKEVVEEVEEDDDEEEEAKCATLLTQSRRPETSAADDAFLEPGSCLPPHIATLVYDRSEPARPGLRGDLLRAIEGVLSDKESFERLALSERTRLRQRLREVALQSQGSRRRRLTSSTSSSRLSNDPVNLRVIKAGLRERAQSLQAQVQIAREDCEAHARAVKFARNFLEQEAARREEERAKLERSVAELRRRVSVLHEKAASALPPVSMKRTQDLVRQRLDKLPV